MQSISKVKWNQATHINFQDTSQSAADNNKTGPEPLQYESHKAQLVGHGPAISSEQPGELKTRLGDGRNFKIWCWFIRIFG